MKRIILISAASAVVIAGGAYGVFALVAGGGPDPVALSTTSPAAGSGSLDGEWKLAASNSFVGYRVREKLAFLPAPSDAVGRTSAVDGSMKISGKTVDDVDVHADLGELRSDKAMRDRRVHELGLETARFPDARFVLSDAISFETKPSAGRRVSRTATGKLTLHGVTRDVTVPIRAQWTAGRVEVIGSLDIDFADYQIEPIRLSQVTTEDHGTMEFRLVFVPA